MSLIISSEKDIGHIRRTGKHVEYRVKNVPNLILRVTPTGTKTWSYLYRPEPKVRRKIALGVHPKVKLTDAKRLATEYAAKVNRGGDPLAEKTPPPREEATGAKFREVASAYLAERAKVLARKGKTSRWIEEEAQRLLDKDVLPHIGDKEFDGIARSEVSEVVERVAERGSYATANKVLALIKAVFTWANNTGRSDHNPVASLKKRSGVSKPRERSLGDQEIKTLWKAIETTPKMDEGVRDALRLQLLLATRIGETLGAEKKEFDVKQGIWTIPAVKTKGNREHRLPLSPMALEIIKRAMARSGSSPFLFPSPHDGEAIRPKSASRAVMRLTRRIGLDDARSHDLRRTCNTYLRQMKVPDDVRQAILNHAPTTVEGRHYNRADLIDEMREALDAWAERLQQIIASSV